MTKINELGGDSVIEGIVVFPVCATRLPRPVHHPKGTVPLHLSPFRLDHLGSPTCVSRILSEMPVEVGGTIGPPDRASFAQSPFGIVHGSASGCQGVGTTRTLGCFDSPAGIHEFVDKALTLLLTQTEVGGSP